MKKVILIILVLFFAVTLIGCKENEQEDYTIYEGMVVDKIFDAGYTYTTYVLAGKVRVPMHHTVPDKYYIVIYKNEQIAKHRVTKSFYDTFEIGTFITIGSENLENNKEE